jgi:hypothetical protein
MVTKETLGGLRLPYAAQGCHRLPYITILDCPVLRKAALGCARLP